jgi:delta(3,5)-delta(2,4)-dienoyl-CoA isomerase
MSSAPPALAECESDVSLLLSSWPALSSLSLSSPSPYVLHVELCHGRVNSMTRLFWQELRDVCERITEHVSRIRVVLLSGRGDVFSAGLDLRDHSDLFLPPPAAAEPSRLALQRLRLISRYQQSISAVERLPQPVICFLHGPAIGGAVDLLTATDIRIATSSFSLSVKEVDLGLAADVGTLQRLGRLVGNASAVHDWALTARTVSAEEAARVGLVSGPLSAGREEGWRRAVQLAQLIAAKSPVAVLGTKRFLLQARDHSVQDGLEAVALWNMTMLQSEDVRRSGAAWRAAGGGGGGSGVVYSNL